MTRTRLFAAGLAMFLAAPGLRTAGPVRAQQDPGDQAYYIVVLPADGSGGNLQTSQVSDDSGTHVQVSGNLSVDCTRYGSADDADAAAGQLHAGANWTVVLAPDALHALLIANGLSPDLAGFVPPAQDADVCTPATS